MSETKSSLKEACLCKYILQHILRRGQQLNSLGQHIRAARESSGFTQENLAEAVGVSRTAVARWESDDIEPKLQNLISIAELLHVSTDSLLGIDTRRSNSVSDLPDEAIYALERFIAEIKKSVQDT